jgi:V-type H+-transporting ATPase subunit d
MITISSKRKKGRKLFLISVWIKFLYIPNIKLLIYLILIYLNTLGYLYPAITFQLTKVNSFEALKEALAPYPVYYNMIKDVPDPKKIDDFSIQGGLKTLDDVMFEELTKKYSIAFEEQFHYASVYAYIKIKEQEIKNIIWLAEMISLDVKDSGSKLKKNYILPFNY